MRPSPVLENDNQRPRNASHDLTNPTSSGPTTFFLTRESDLKTLPSSQAAGLPYDTSPVRTLKETLEEAGRAPRVVQRRSSKQNGRSLSRRRSTIRPSSNEQLRQQSNTNLAHPNATASTPPLPPSQEISLPASPKSASSRSFVKSDDELTQDETHSQAIESSEEEGNGEDVSTHSLQDSAPQLVMPSIRMPSRRPFTERGKSLSHFKIMVAGSQGSGKTSLVKSIVQVCEDIVHVDSVSANKPLNTASSRAPSHTFNEIYASTRPYPRWWSDVDQSQILKRRKSIGDAVLERNVCFVDTINLKTPSRTSYYLEQQLVKTIALTNQVTSGLTGLLSGKGGAQVDVVLYLISYETFRDDYDHIQRLSRIANVVPLIAKCDLLTTAQIDEIKAVFEQISCSLPQLPAFSPDNDQEAPSHKAPYCISSLNGPDFDNMDASVLMSSEYVQPLLPSELGFLVDQLFQAETISYLRYTAAQKLVSWYNSDARIRQTRTPSVQSSAPSTLNSPLQASVSASGVLVPLTSELSLNTSNSFALAKVADHAQREEQLAHVRLSKWASDLQLSLQRERERYESLARSQRAQWLVQRMGDEIRDGQVLAINSGQALVKTDTKIRFTPVDGISYQIHDPLGLLRWRESMRAKGWIALQIIGSFGLVGGLALWTAKTWGWGSSLYQWAQDWGAWNDS